MTTNNLFDLSEKTIIVTGGLGQLGRQYTNTLLDAGSKVASLDLAESVPDETFEKANRDNFLFIKTDIAAKESLEKARDQIIENWGNIHGLVNNAALDSPPNAPESETGPFEEYPVESFDKVIDVNLKGTFLCCQVFGSEMAKHHQGSIVNIGSTYGLVSPDQSIYEYRRQRGETFFKPVAYAASKSGVYNLTRYLAAYWGKAGVRVNTLSPGGVFNNQEDEFLKNYCARVPMGRMAQEDEYNGAIIFLLSEASRYMTGSNLVIDGGWTAI